MFAKTPSTHVALAAGLALLIGCASSTSSPSEQPPETAKPEPAEQKVELESSGAGSPAWAPVYFDTDSSLLRPGARQALKEHAERIVAHPEWGTLVIEGHCDERGSEEYNLALGERRAAGVAQYLVDLGVPEGRLEVRTYGEARPAVPGSTEAAWQKNRRAELERGMRESARRSSR